MNLVELYGVELALGGADAAAEALSLVYYGNAAAHAAGGLLLKLFLCKCGAGIVHGLERLARGGVVRTLTGLLVKAAVIPELLIKGLVLALAANEKVLALDVPVHGNSAGPAGCNGVDGKAGAHRAVAAGEDVFLGGLIGDLGNIDDSEVLNLGLGAAQEISPHNRLPDRGEHVGAGHDNGVILVVNGAEPAGFVKYGHAAHEFHARDATVFANDALRTPAVANLHSLCQSLVLFVGNGGHFLVLFEADHFDIAVAETHYGASHVYGHVSAAYHHGVALNGGDDALVHAAKEVDAALDADELLALNAELTAGLRADGDVEGLVALLTKLLYSHVPADVDAAFELHAQPAQNLDLRVYDVFFESEGGYAELQHTAGSRVLLEHRDGIALHREIVRGGHSGGAGAYYGYLFLVAVFFLRYVEVPLLELLVGDELLDVVDGHGLVDAGAGAFVFTVMRTDSPADCGEGIVPLDDLERLVVFALCGLADIALDRYVRGAGGLAGSTAALVYHLPLEVIHIPELLRPVGVHVVRKVLGFALRLAEIRAEGERVGVAGFDARAAGHALFGIHLGDKVGGHVHLQVEHIGRAQRGAAAAAAVADKAGGVVPLGVEHLVDVPSLLHLSEYFVDLLLGDLPGSLGTDAVVCVVVKLDAGVYMRVLAAHAQSARSRAAGAVRDGELGGLVYEGLQLLEGHDRGFGGHGLHYRYCPEPAVRSFLKGHGGHVRETDALLVEIRGVFQQLGVYLLVQDDELKDARQPGPAAVFEHAGQRRAHDQAFHAHLFKSGSNFLDGHVVRLGYFVERFEEGLAHHRYAGVLVGAEMQQELYAFALVVISLLTRIDIIQPISPSNEIRVFVAHSHSLRIIHYPPIAGI